MLVSSVHKTNVQCIQGGGKTGELIRAFDWTNTTIGSILEWPQSLKTSVNIMLQSPVPMVMLWGQEGIMLYNDAYSEFAGGRHPTLLGSKVLEGWPEVADFNRNVMEKGLAGETLSYQNQRLTLYRNGIPEDVWMDLNYSPIFDENGQPAGVLAIVVETTQRVKAERAVRESEERFRVMAEASDFMIWQADANGQLLYLNKKLLDFLGADLETISQNNWLPYFFPNDVPTISAKLEKAIAGVESYCVEVRMWHEASKEYRWVISSGAPTYREDGTLSGLVGSVVDIHDRKLAEEALKESEARYSLVVQGMNDGLWDWDILNNSSYCNDRFYELLGLSPQDKALVHGEAIWSLVHPDDLQRVSEALRAHFEEHIPYQLELRMRHHSGKYRYFRASAQAVWDDAGVPIRVAGVMTDIHDQKQIELEIRESEERFRLLADSAPILIAMSDVDTDLTYFNKTWLEYTGRTLEEELAFGWINGVHPEDREHTVNTYLAAYQDKVGFEVEYRLMRYDGEYRWMYSKVAPRFTAIGDFSGYIGSVVDIHDRKIAEQALKESEERFRTMADTAPAMIWMSNADGELIYRNNAFAKFYGLSDASSAIMEWEPYVHPDDLEWVKHAFYKAAQNKEAFYLSEHRLKRYDGEYRWLIANGVPRISMDGEFQGFIGSVLDITDRRKAEDALKESEAKFRRLADSNMIGILFWDLEGRALEGTNDAFLHMLGFTQDDLLAGRVRWNDLTPPEYEEVTRNAIRQLRETGVFHPFEKQFYRRDGSRVDTLMAGAFFEGSKEKGVCYVLDITQRKQAENAVKESESRFRAMADSAPLFVWVNGVDGTTQYVNKTWTDFLGMSAEEAIAYGLQEAMAPELQATASETYRAAMMKREPYTLEAGFRRHDGETRYLLTKGAPLLLPNGEVNGYIGTSIDITDRKEVEERLQHNLEREKLIRHIVEVIGQSFDIDQILQIVVEELGRYLNADRCGITRYTFSDEGLSFNLFAQYWKEGCKPTDPRDIEVLTNAFRQLNPQAFLNEREQITNISNQKEYLEHLYSGMLDKFPKGLPGLSAEELIGIVQKYDIQSAVRVNIYYRGAPYGSLSVYQSTYNRVWTSDEVDLVKTIADHVGSAIYQAELYRQAQDTALKEQNARLESETYARRLEASNRELEQFATIASHDLREPLRKIQIFSEMLDDKVVEEGRDYLKRMGSAANRMQTLMDDLLTLSRVNRKGQAFQSVDLNAIVRAVLEDMEVAICDAQAEVSVESLTIVQADGSQIRQLMQNLIANAVKYHREGVKPHIKIYGEQQGSYYAVIIEDNGIGIQKEHFERIFEPFQRLHGIGRYPGTGIGLTICKKIIDRHSGTLNVESEPGQGTRFIFTLPVPQ